MNSNTPHSRSIASRNSDFSMLLGFFFLAVSILLTGSACFYSGVICRATCNPAVWTWPKTEGVVLKSEQKTSGLRRPSNYDWSQYSYSVNGHQYTKTGMIGS
jgi:hypothetical protein